MIKKPDNGNEDFDRGNISTRKFVKNVSLIVGALFLISIIILVLFPDPFINTILKNRIAKSFEKEYPKYTIQLGEMKYSVWNNFLECDSIILQTKDSSFTCIVDSFSISGISWIKILLQSDFNPNAFSSSIINAEKIYTQ